MTRNPGLVYGSVLLMVEKVPSGFVTIDTLSQYSVNSGLPRQIGKIGMLNKIQIGSYK